MNPIKIGITGQIATGKSFVSATLKKWGYPVYESDTEVKKLYNNPTITGQILKKFEKISEYIEMENGQIDKEKLGVCVFNNITYLRQLEKIIHPILQKQQLLFIDRNAKKKKIFFDIPLLFQKKLQSNFDFIVFTTVCKKIQKERALQRPLMTHRLFKKILQRQKINMKMAQKYISLELDTSYDKEHVEKKIRQFLND